MHSQCMFPVTVKITFPNEGSGKKTEWGYIRFLLLYLHPEIKKTGWIWWIITLAEVTVFVESPNLAD